MNESPLLPKLRVTPVPRSHVAAFAETVDVDGVDTPALKNAAVTSVKIADGAISENHINPSAQINVDRIGLGGVPATSLDLGAKTDAVRLPLGTNTQRPTTPANGDTRYNTETNTVESYVNGAWQSLATGAGTVAVGHGGTGATDAPTARANLSAAASGANADITSLAGLTTPLSVPQGGIGSTTTQNYVFSAPDSANGAPSFRGLVSTDIPNLDASKTNSGVFDTARIPDLDAAKITSGVLEAARIPAGSNGSDRLPLAGGTMTGAIDMGGNNITNDATLAASTVTVSGNPVVVAPAPLTSGSVLFADSASSAGQDNSNLFWDNTNKRLGIGTASPGAKLDVNQPRGLLRFKRKTRERFFGKW